MKNKYDAQALLKIAAFSLLLYSGAANSYQIFVDYSYGGTEEGTESQPFNTLQEAYNEVVMLVQNGYGTQDGALYTASEPFYIEIKSQDNNLQAPVTLYSQYGSNLIDFTGRNSLTIQSHYQNNSNRAMIYSTALNVGTMFNIQVNHVCFNMLKIHGGTSVGAVIMASASNLTGLSIKNCLFAFQSKYNGQSLSIGGTAITAYYGDWKITDIELINNIFVGRDAKGGQGLYCSDPLLEVINNTFIKMSVGFRIDNANLTYVTVKNNITISQVYGLAEVVNCTQPMRVDHCLAHDLQNAAYFIIGYSDVSYVDTLLRDPKIVSSDPLSEEIATILPGSPCIDNGTGDASIGIADYYALGRNNLPDIGAVEFNNNFAVSRPETIYVQEDFEGDVSECNGEFTSPFKTIQAAFNAIPGGMAMRPYLILLKKNTNGSSYANGLNADLHVGFSSENPLTIASADMSNRVEIAKNGTIFYLFYLKHVLVEGITFRSLDNLQYNQAFVGAHHGYLGRTDFITVSKCKFISTETAPLFGISALGDSLVVENCLFYSSYSSDSYRCIDQGTYGGKYYTIANNTAIGNWRYFLIMSDLSGTRMVNNMVSGIAGQTNASYGWAIEGGNRTQMALNKGNYIYLRTDANKDNSPLINTDITSPVVGMPQTGSPAIITETGTLPADYYYGPEVPRDDYYGKYDPIARRDIGAVEYNGFAFKEAAFYSRDESGNVTAEFDKSQALKFTNIYGNDLVGKEVISNDGTKDFYYYIKNHLGSTMCVVDKNGNKINATQYYAYGKANDLISSSMPVDVTETFTGKELDEDGTEEELGINGGGVGSYYFDVRYYDPEIGQFQSCDIMNEFWSPYNYGPGNPISGTDPDGLDWYYVNENVEWIDQTEEYAYLNNEGYMTVAPSLGERYVEFYGSTSYYNEIGLGATAVVYAPGGEINVFDARTQPSLPFMPTLKEGPYSATVGFHKMSYPALRLSNGGNVPTTNINPKTGTSFASGVNIHKAGKGNYTGWFGLFQGVSEACLLIDRNRYNEFMKYMGPAGTKVPIYLRRY